MGTLRADQVAGVKYLQGVGRGYLADEPGLGKTPQAVMAAEGRTLVVAPAMLVDVWDSHVRDWRPDLDYTFTSYNALPRRLPNEQGRMLKTGEMPRADYRGHWDTVIWDEAHYLKERDTKWTKASLRLQTDRAWLLTGTPIVNWAHELYTGLVMIHGKRGAVDLNSYWRWIDRWFTTYDNPHAIRNAGIRGAYAKDIEGLREPWTWEQFATGNGLDGRWLRRTLDEAELPPLTSQTIHVGMTGPQAQVYKDLKAEAYARIEETGTEVISWSQGGVWVKLMKVATGLSSEDPTVVNHNSGKMEALADLLRDRTRPTLVFTCYRSTAEACARVALKLGKRCAIVSGSYPMDVRRANARLFQEGHIDVLIGTHGTISEGLTLTAADCCIFVERDPRPSKNEQAVKRIHRYTQTRPCLRIDLVTRGTVDAALVTLLATKTDHQMEALRAIDLVQLL